MDTLDLAAMGSLLIYTTTQFYMNNGHEVTIHHTPQLITVM